ncbi:hypothetical protein V6Z12_A06G218300 [Gossypium hirsutum]
MVYFQGTFDGFLFPDLQSSIDVEAYGEETRRGEAVRGSPLLASCGAGVPETSRVSGAFPILGSLGPFMNWVRLKGLGVMGL